MLWYNNISLYNFIYLRVQADADRLKNTSFDGTNTYPENVFRRSDQFF